MGRNEQCACGSGKKYKYCYEQEGSGCSLAQQNLRKELLKEHSMREEEVVKFILEVAGETTIINLTDKKGDDSVPVRIQMMILFSLIDVLGSYWYEYLGKTGRTSERPEVWYNTFCAIDRNKHFVGLWRNISSTRLSTFRNALVHFFGMGEESEGISIMLAPNNLKEEERQKWEEGLSKAKHKTIVIRPRAFSDLIKEGAILMLKEWEKNIIEAQHDRVREEEHINGIRRVWAKVRKEGAVAIDISKSQSAD